MRRNRNILIGLAAAAVLITFGLVAWLRPADSGPPPGLDPSQYGWAGPEAVEAAKPIVDRLPKFRILNEPGVSQATGPVNVRLWYAADKIGVEIRNVRQQIGDCVSWGYRNGIAYLQCVGLWDGSIRGTWHDPSSMYLYGTGRVLIGDGRLSGDGSLGAWQQEAIRRYGVLPADTEGVPSYSGRIARQWGAPPGPPQQLIDLASDFCVETTALVESAEDVAAAITNGYPVPICSDFGTRSFRVADGRRIAVGDGSWNHCMCLIGYDETAPSGERYFYCLNSWGPDAHPSPLGDEPEGGFWLTYSQVDWIAQQGDSFALSNFRGFPARRIDFRILAKSTAAEEGGHHAQHLRGSTRTGGIVRRAFHPDGPSGRLPAIGAGGRGADDPGGLSGLRAAVVPATGPGRPARSGFARLLGPCAASDGVDLGFADGSTGRHAGDGTATRADVPCTADRRTGSVSCVPRIVWCAIDTAGLFDARRGGEVADRDVDGATVSDRVLRPAALSELQAVRAGDVSRTGQEWLAGGTAADRTSADLRGQGRSAGGGVSGVLAVRDRLTPYPDPAFGGPGDRPDRGAEGDAPTEHGWIRPADLGQDLRPVDGRGLGEVDARQQARHPELFGPSPAQLRALADRAVDRTLGQAGRAIEAKVKQLAWTAAGIGAAGCACTGAACGLMIVLAKFIGWLLLRLMAPPRRGKVENG